MKKATRYTINELEGQALENALRYIRETTGLTDPEDQIIEAEVYGITFDRNGKNAKQMK